MNIKVQGPNLSRAAQAKGHLHIHAAGCADNDQYGYGRKHGGEEAESVLVDTLEDVIHFIYGGHIAENECNWTDYEGEFWVAPCAQDLG